MRPAGWLRRELGQEGRFSLAQLVVVVIPDHKGGQREPSLLAQFLADGDSGDMISIIVPVYNAEKYIAQTIQTVVDQTYTDWELILVDDVSTDGSVAAIRAKIAALEGERADSVPGKFAREGRFAESEQGKVSHGEPSPVAQRIRLICKKRNVGAAKARNTGLDAAKGRFICFLDADDVWKPKKLQWEMEYLNELQSGDGGARRLANGNDDQADVRGCRQAGALEESRSEAGDGSGRGVPGFVFCAYEFGDENAKPTGRGVKAPERLDFRHALTRTVIFTSTTLFDTNVIPKDLLRMPDMGSEDTATWWTILKQGYYAYGLNEPLVIYRRPEQSLSSNKKKASGKIWRLYKDVAELSDVKAAFCFGGWAIHATLRRVLPVRW